MRILANVCSVYTLCYYKIELSWHHGVAVEDRLCRLCGQQHWYATEDEYHVFYHCSAYNEGRNLYNFIMFLQLDNQDEIIQVANFISCMFKTRRQLL